MALLHRIFRKRKYVIVFAGILGGLAAFLYAEAPSPVYSARALVRITNNVTVAQLITDIVSYNSYDRMATQSILISSRLVLENVAMRLNLVREGESPEAAIEALRRRVRAEQQANSDILAILCTGPSENEAITLTNAVLEAYIETYRSERERNRGQSLSLVRGRTDEAQASLARAESALLDFRRTHNPALAISPGMLDELRDRQQEYEERLKGLRSSLETVTRIAKDKDYNALVESNLILDDVVARSMVDEAQRLAMAFADQTAWRNQLLRFQTEAAPPVMTAASTIENLDRRLQAQLAGLSARLRDAVRDTERRLNDASSRAAHAQRQPDLSAQLDELMLDVRRKQETVAGLRDQLQNLEIQQSAKAEEVTVIESAHSAVRTVSRSRLYSTLGGILVGVLFGAVLTLMLKTANSLDRENRVGRSQEMRDIMSLTDDEKQ